MQRQLNEKLDAYIRRKHLTNKGFARLVSEASGGRTISARTVENWRYSVSVPRGWALEGIFKVTGGELTPNDFVRLERLP